ncbi:unnamed protein product [Rotaria socialis]|uniref:Uncharacterized protein n=1 Tax=Rotaria socialis TaxID=392032 RepID=A0A818UCK7_9BILA|nr:unnamed protein product [Rotaria socialis]CAF3696498.1 unnamed protein product [Rotaria socialis]CAF4108922.1 unnamed protein product [Rotaria socialis]CAF4259198.1 unnamed protein product [Rotaria socialis]
MNFLTNHLENRVSFGLNGDDYIGGEGFGRKLERFTHIDFNRDNIIDCLPDVYSGYPSMYGTENGDYPSMGYGGYPGLSFHGLRLLRLYSRQFWILLIRLQ